MREVRIMQDLFDVMDGRTLKPVIGFPVDESPVDVQAIIKERREKAAAVDAAYEKRNRRTK